MCARSGGTKGAMAVYDTIADTIVFKKIDLATFNFGAESMPQLRVSSGANFFGIFNDGAQSSKIYEIDLNFISDEFIAFSNLGDISFTTESISALTVTNSSIT